MEPSERNSKLAAAVEEYSQTRPVKRTVQNRTLAAHLMAAILRSVGDLLTGASWLFGFHDELSHRVGRRTEHDVYKRVDMGAPRRAMARTNREVDRGIARTLQSRLNADCE